MTHKINVYKILRHEPVSSFNLWYFPFCILVGYILIYHCVFNLHFLDSWWSSIPFHMLNNHVGIFLCELLFVFFPKSYWVFFLINMQEIFMYSSCEFCVLSIYLSTLYSHLFYLFLYGTIKIENIFYSVSWFSGPSSHILVIININIVYLIVLVYNYWTLCLFKMLFVYFNVINMLIYIFCREF